jgi:hypothetical protein
MPLLLRSRYFCVTCVPRCATRVAARRKVTVLDAANPQLLSH